MADDSAIESLAKRLRAKALSGYTWNVAATWEEADWFAQYHWRLRAAKMLDDDARQGATG